MSTRAEDPGDLPAQPLAPATAGASGAPVAMGATAGARALLAAIAAAMALAPAGLFALVRWSQDGPAALPAIAAFLGLPVLAASATAYLLARLAAPSSGPLALAVTFMSLWTFCATDVVQHTGTWAGPVTGLPIAAVALLFSLLGLLAYRHFDRRLVAEGSVAASLTSWRGLVMMAGHGVVTGILVSAVAGHGVVDSHVASSSARNRVLAGVIIAEEYAAENGGAWPVSAPGGAMTTMWKAKRPDDHDLSPWGGRVGPGCPDGILEVPAVVGDQPTSEAAARAANAGGDHGAAPDPARAAALIYLPVQPGPRGEWRGIEARSGRGVEAVKGYAVGIYDKNGNPWWEVKGGK